jgi:hypothetical protein
MPMKSIYSISVATIILLVLGGCSASGQKFSGFLKPSNGKALVYFYRTDSFIGSLEPKYIVGRKVRAEDDKVKVDGDDKTIVKLRNNSFIKKEFDPGEYKFMISLLVGESIKLEADTLSCMEANNIFIPNIIGADMERCKSEIAATIEMTEKDEEEIF